MSPERSTANVRLSVTVITAMRTGLKATHSSIGTECPSVRMQSYRCLSVHSGKARPQSLCEAGKAAFLFTRLLWIHPVITHDDGHISTGFIIRDGLNKQQRIAVVMNFVIPSADRNGASIIGRHNLGQQTARRAHIAQPFQITLTIFHRSEAHTSELQSLMRL